MKPILVAFAIMLLPGGCKKLKEDITEQRAWNLLDGTEWKITSYTNDSADLSGDFSPYIFRFNKEGTINALRNNSIETTGNWKGDIANRTMFAHFPSARHPIQLLNATWTIMESTTSSLTANTGAGTGLRQLKMEKQ